MVTYVEKSGESIEEAIIILDVKNNAEGIAAEYEYLEMKFGESGKAWEMEIQGLIHEDNKHYDILELRFPDGAKKTIYFDITSFYGKW